MACIQAEYQENEKGAKSGLKIHHQAHHYIIINDWLAPPTLETPRQRLSACMRAGSDIPAALN